MTTFEAGTFVLVRGTLRFNGHVEEVFREEWQPHPEREGRVLTKHPADAPGTGRVIAAVRLVRPFDTDNESSPVPNVQPFLDEGSVAEVVYVPVDLLETVPNGF